MSHELSLIKNYMRNYMGNYMAIICLNKEHELPLMSHELNIKLNMNENII